MCIIIIIILNFQEITLCYFKARMQITVTTADGSVLQLDVSDDLPLLGLKALLEVDTGISPDKMLLIHNMAPLLDDKKGLNECGVQDGDIIVVTEGNSSAVNISSPPPLPSQAPHQLPQQQQPHSQPSQRAQSQSASNPLSIASSLPLIDWSSVQIPTRNPPSTSGVAARSPAAAHPPPPLDPQASSSGLPFDPDTLVQHFLANPEELAALQQRNPHLAEAILSGDAAWISETMQAYRTQMMVRGVEGQIK